ncbi:MAG TPA: hypothetical protein VGH86_01410 [Phenylobacterium sp.]|jgi:hypothetical protein
MTATMDEAYGPLDIGRVIQSMFQVLGRNFVTFLVLAVILSGIPAVLVGLMQLNFLNRGELFSWPSFVGGIVSGLAGLILEGTVIYGTVTDLNGRRASLADCLSVGLRSFLPLLAIAILLGISVAFGALLLIVPGVMLAIAWCVAVPSYVVEQTGVLGAFARSAELTRGNRWRIFGLFIIYFVATIILEVVLGVFSGAASLASGGGVSFLQAIILGPLFRVAAALLGATATAALYVELRRVRDGVGADSLAAIFD